MRVPRYQLIARDLTRRIVDGEYPIGATLPPERELAGAYGCARGTARAALQELERRGLIAARQGAGWEVRSSLRHQQLGELRSFAQWARNKGMRPGGLVVSTERGRATAAQARALRLAPGAAVVHVTRLRTLDDRITMLERTVYADWLVDIVERLPPDEASVVAALEERHGVITAHADHTIDVVAASSEDARLLEVRRTSPLLRVRRTSFAQDGRAIECGDDRYLPGTMSFHASSSRGSRLVRSPGAGG